MNHNTMIDSSAIPIPFWSENPNILFKPEYITEFYPSVDMQYAQKLNAISRLVLLITSILFVYGQSSLTIVYGIITLASIYFVHSYHESAKEKSENHRLENHRLTEGMDVMLSGDKTNNPAIGVYADSAKTLPTNVFDDPTPQNPFSNVLVTDYDDNPNKKPAPPAFNYNVKESILNQAKTAVQEANPDQPDIADKLFKDLGEQLMFEQSMRPFYSTANTTVPNDQQAFSDFCYGSMVSCKEGNQFACARNLARHTNT